MKAALIGAIATAAVSTLGDYLWANVLPHGQPVYWFAHAIVLFLTIGACLGVPSRRPVVGAFGAVLIGCLATAGFWILRPVVGYAGSMFLLFAVMWVALGVLTGRVLQRRDNVLNGDVASVREFNPHGWDYGRHFVYWTIAYLPAFAALLSRRQLAS